jgi:hypothetical protein
VSNSENEVEDLVMVKQTGELIDLKSLCSLCSQPVDRYSPDAWKQVKGWVGGPRKDSMRLREDTGYYAHQECVLKLSSGQAVDQDTLFDDPEGPFIAQPLGNIMKELFDDDNS